MRDSSLRIVVSLERGIESDILPELTDRPHLTVVTAWTELEVLDKVHAEPTHALVIDCGHALTARVVSACDAAGVRLVVIADTEASRRRAREFGVVDALPGDAPWTEIERTLSGQILDPVAPPPRERGALSIAVWGPHGAPGRSTVATHLAAEFARAGRSTLLIDADPYGGSIALRLGLLDEVPTFAAAARLTDVGGLTRGEFERLAQRYEGNGVSFAVLTGLIRPDRWPELSSARVTAVLAACAEWVDAIVIDTGFSLETDEEIVSDVRGPRRNACTLAVLAAADETLVVGAPDPIGLSRLLRAHQGVCDLVDPSRVRVVVNSLRSSAVGIGARAQVLGTLRRFGGITSPFLLPDDRSGLDSAVLAGRLLHEVSRRSPFLAATRQLCESILRSADARDAALSPARDRSVRERRRRSRRGRAGEALGGPARRLVN